MSVVLDRAIADELARLEQAVADAAKKVEAAQEVAASEDLQNEVLANQRQGLVDLDAFVEDELRPLGLSAIIDPRSERTDGRSLEEIYDSGAEFDDVRDRLINLLEISGVRTTRDVAMFGMRRPQRTTVQEIANLTVRQIIEWLEGAPDVVSGSDAASQQLGAAEAELAKAESDLEAFGDTSEERQGWLREKGVLIADDLPVSEREGFDAAERSASFVDPQTPVSEFSEAFRATPPTTVQPPGDAASTVRPPGDVARGGLIEADTFIDIESPTLKAVQEKFPALDLIVQQAHAAAIDAGLYALDDIGGSQIGLVDPDTGDPDTGDPDAGGPAVPAVATLTDEDIAMLAVTQGYGARFLAIRSGDPENPDIGDVLIQAAAEGWYDSPAGVARFIATVSATPWFNNYLPGERAHQMLESTDPRAAQALVDTQVDRLNRVINRLGLNAHDVTGRLREIARQAHVENWSDYDMNQYMLMEADWAAGQAGGAVGANYRNIDATVSDYMVSHLVSDDDRDRWAEGLFLGDVDQATLTNEIAQLAESAYPSMTDRIKQGYSVRQIVSPLRAEASRLLERNITDQDFLENTNFSRMLRHVDDGAERLMTVSEVSDYVRTLDEWQTTKNARRSAREFADFVGKKFGRAA